MSLRPETRRALDDILARVQRDSRLPSIVAGVVRGGELVWSGAAGFLTGRADGPAPATGTQYRIGSITKTMVAVAVLRLRDAGALELTDRVSRHLPELDLGSATVEALLTHSAGVQAETVGPWWERTAGGSWADLVESGVGQRFRTGLRFHYSNVGFAVLGRLIEVRTGGTWFEVVRSELLEPLGMRETTLRPLPGAAPGLAVHPFADLLLPEPEHDAGAMAPAGQVWSTVPDLARWAAFLGGDTAGVLSAQTLAEMCQPRAVVEEPGQPWTAAHGLGVQVWNEQGTRYVGHGGSMPGFLAGVRVRLDSGDGVLTMSNTTSSTGPREALRAVTAALDELEPAPAVAWSAAGDPALLELTGTWHWGPSVTTASLVGEHLVLGEPGSDRGSRFIRRGPDHWEGLDGYYTGEPLHVVRDSSGRVHELDIASFRLTRTPYAVDADIPGGVDEAGWA